MSLIVLQFTPEMESAILGGRKCCTSRRERHGNPGDRFIVGDVVYQIVDVLRVDLGEVAEAYFRLEGFDTGQEFRDFWIQVYNKPVTDWDMVYVHFFARLGGAS